MGIRFKGGKQAFLQAGLAGALGTVEVRPLDLTSAYGTIANDGAHVPPRMILEVRDATGKTIYKAPDPKPVQTVSPQAAYLVTNILAGNTDPSRTRSGRRPSRSATARRPHRPVAVKTGTANDARDLATYGYLGAADRIRRAGPRGRGLDGQQRPLEPAHGEARDLADGRGPALARVRSRRQREDCRSPTSRRPNSSAPRSTRGPAGGPVRGRGPTAKELFIDGTQPGAKHAIDRDGLLYDQACGGWRVDPLKAELGPARVGRRRRDWMAGPGAGRASPAGSTRGPRTSGTSIRGAARSTGRAPSRSPSRRPRRRRRCRRGHGGGPPGGGGGGGGAGHPAPTPKPKP